MDRREVIFRAIKHWGTLAQMHGLLKEMGELQAVTLRYWDSGALAGPTTEQIAEKIADVEIMLEQAKAIFSVEEETLRCRARKIAQLEEQLQKIEAEGKREEDNYETRTES